MKCTLEQTAELLAKIVVLADHSRHLATIVSVENLPLLAIQISLCKTRVMDLEQTEETLILEESGVLSGLTTKESDTLIHSIDCLINCASELSSQVGVVRLLRLLDEISFYATTCNLILCPKTRNLPEERLSRKFAEDA